MTTPSSDTPPANLVREARRSMTRLRDLAARLDHQAALIRNGGFNPAAEAQAGGLADDASAIRWALRRIAPEAEAVGQVFAALRGMGPGSPPTG